MKILAIAGCRNKDGKTAQAMEALLQGVPREGNQTESVFLPERKIDRCHQCEDDGWGRCRTEGLCEIVDDFAGLVDKIKQADALAFSTPVYFGDLSESLRAFLDRLRRTCSHEVGKKGLIEKPAVGICVAGGGGSGAPHCTVSLEKVLGECGLDVVDMIPVRKQNLDLKKTLLRTTGQWLAAYADERSVSD
jgi:multimeric flavodoxin WrbA